MARKKIQLRDFNDYLVEELKNPELAQEYLNTALEEYQQDNDTETFLSMLKDITIAQGGIQQLAQRTQLNRQNIYKIFSAKRTPKINTLGSILNGLGLRLSVSKL
jgi:probable addiction module antidote protein